MDKNAVFGTSGRTGKLFTELVLKEGYKVRALVRQPVRLSLQHPNLEIMQGDTSDPIKVEETIKTTEAVIDLIGPGKGSSSDLQRTATRHILQAMHQNHVKRLIVLASVPFGVLDSNDKPSLMNKLMLLMAKGLMAGMVEDARGHIDLIKQSNLNWTVVRAPRLNDQASQGKYRVGYLDASTGKDISRVDVAAFMLESLKNDTYIQQMPLLSN